MLPSSYETILDKIKQDWFLAGWKACEKESELREISRFHADLETERRRNKERFKDI